MFEIQYERCEDCGKAKEYGRECSCQYPSPTAPDNPRVKELEAALRRIAHFVKYDTGPNAKWITNFIHTVLEEEQS